MKTDHGKERLLDQQVALSTYLEVMLQDEVAPNAEIPPDVPGEPLAPAEKSPTVEQAGMATAGLATNVPGWATVRFQALLFDVAGLALAVPLSRLKGVIPNEVDLTPGPGHSPQFPGVVPYEGIKSTVVDTARFILPQDRAAQLDANVTGRGAHLVVIDEGRWALACDGIGEMIELEATDVKWRGADGKRAWLAGTVIGKMVALLDIDELSAALASNLA